MNKPHSIPMLESELVREKRIAQLRAELHSYGYIAFPRDHIRRVAASTVFYADEAYRALKRREPFLFLIAETLGRQIGQVIAGSGAFKLSDAVVGSCGQNREYRMTVCFLVDDPLFDLTAETRLEIEKGQRHG